MTFKYATGLIATYSDGSGNKIIARNSIIPAAVLPVTPTFNTSATTQPIEITQGGVGGNNRRNSQAEIDMHAASEVALLAVPKTPDRTAVQDGWWDDTATWGGTVPVADDQVLIPAGINVWVKADIPKIKTVLCHGFFGVWEDASVDITIEIETFIGSRTSMFWIGDATRPALGNITWTQPQTSLVIADDPNMQGKGIVLLGRCRVHGIMTTSYMLTNGTDLMTGATGLTLAATPVNWNVGDEIAIPPTRMISPGSTNSGTPEPGNEVERRTIDTINGAVITWVGGLTFDHDMPTEAKNIGDDAIHIANLTRNIKFDSPPAAAVHERGHIMLMHTNGDCDWRYVEHAYLGRTDKRANAWAFSEHPDNPAKGGGGMTPTSNIFGRYQFHFHLNGPDSVDDNHVEGCSFRDGFGLGCVVHGSRATVTENCSADFNGAHFLTEAGNEEGVYDGWVAIGLLTDTPDFTNKGHVSRHDWGKNQIFWFQSRIPTLRRFTAYGASNGTGMVWNIRGSRSREIRPRSLDRRNIEPVMRYMQYTNDLTGEFYDANQALTKTPPLDVEEISSVACLRGTHVIKAGSQQDHNMYSKMDKLRLYNVCVGLETEYTGRYWVNDVYGVQDPRSYGLSPQFEVLCYQAIEAFQFTWRNIEGHGFNYGVDIDHVIAAVSIGPAPADADWHNFVITPNTNVLAGTYRIDDINRTRVGTTARDVIMRENQMSAVPPSYVEDVVEMPDFLGSTRIWSGTATDSLSTRTLPAGRDDEELSNEWVKGLGRLKGCWERSSDGKFFLEIDELVTDAGTGEHFTHTARLFCADGACAADPRNGSGWIPGAFNGTKA